MGSNFATIGRAIERTWSRRRARRSFRKAPRWLVVLVVLAVGSSTLALTDAPVSANTGACSTNTYNDAQQAKDNFINDCGAPFQETPAFSCAWVDEGGWQCAGPGGRQQPSQSVTPAPAPVESSPTVFIPTVQCATGVYNTTQAAQDNFLNDCGAPFEDSPDFRCTRDREGAVCTGPTSFGQAPAGPIVDGQPAGSAREALGSFPGLTGEQRAERFADNIPVLEGLLEALPNPPEDTDQLEEIEDLAFGQALLLLNIDPNDREDLWGMWLRVNRGINPSFHADGVPIFTPFQESFNATGRTQRLEYYGFDEFGWNLAEPYIELSWDMYRTRHALEDPLAPLVQLFTIGVLSLITAGLASGAYAAWFGVSQTSFGAVTFGSVVSSYGTTLFTTRSTAQAEKAALLGALTAGISKLTDIPLLSRPDHVKLSIALLEGGIASLNDGDFTRAFLLSLSEQYLPGIGSFIEQLDNTSPFLVDLGVELVGSYIEHDGEWDLISADVERFFLDEAQEYVGEFIGDQLPESWGDFGDELGELAGVAVTEGGDPVAIRAAVAARVGELAGLGVGSVLGNNDSIIAGITDHLVETWVLADALDPEDRAAFIDGRLTNYVFSLAAEEISSFAGDRLVAANGGESNGLIASTVGLIDLAVSNAWRDSDELEDLLVGYVGNELQGVIRSQFPECAPAWAVRLGDNVVGIVIDRALTGEGGEIGDDVVDLITLAAQTGQIDGTDVGTCNQSAGAGVSPDAAARFVGEVINTPYVPGQPYGSVSRSSTGVVSAFIVDTSGSVTVIGFEAETDISDSGASGPEINAEYVHFELRESENTGLPALLWDAVHDDDWREIGAAQSVLHNDPNTPGVERKFVHEDGREAVYYPNSGRLVTDPRYRGTYNFHNSGTLFTGEFTLHPWGGMLLDDVLHGLFDVIPWYRNGTVRGVEPGAVGNSDCNGPGCSYDLDDDDDLIPAWLDLDDKDPNRRERYPYCTTEAVPEADDARFGSENGTTCAMRAAVDGTLPTTPYCSASFVDNDGDGWGVENDLACVVAGSAAARSIGR